MLIEVKRLQEVGQKSLVLGRAHRLQSVSTLRRALSSRKRAALKYWAGAAVERHGRVPRIAKEIVTLLLPAPHRIEKVLRRRTEEGPRRMPGMRPRKRAGFLRSRAVASTA